MGLVAHRVEVFAGGCWRAAIPAPDVRARVSSVMRLPQEQSGVLVFAAAVETAQHQAKIDDIGFGAGPACLQFCCVLGLKPVRAFLFCFTSFPKPGQDKSPFLFNCRSGWLRHVRFEVLSWSFEKNWEVVYRTTSPSLQHKQNVDFG